LLGKTKNEDAADPWPVEVPGEEKPVSSARIEEFVNEEFFYYYNFFTNCKRLGNPYPSGWLDWPPWTVQIMTAFGTVIDRENKNNEYKFLAGIHGYKVN
jgi:hypothetical protein